MGESRGRDQSELLIVRLLTVGIALVSGIKVLYFLPIIRTEAGIAVPFPFVVGLALEFAIPVVAGILAFGAGLRVLRRMNGATAAGHVLAAVVALWQSSTTDQTVIQPWLLTTAGPVMAALVYLGPTLWAVLGTLAGYAILEFPRPDNAAAYEFLRATFDIQLVTAAVLGGLAAVTMFYSRRLDDLAAEVAAQGKAAAASRARAEVSVMAAAITHDDILSTLLFGAANNPVFRGAVARQAQRALAEIELLATDAPATDAAALPPVANDPVSLTEVWARAAALVRELDPGSIMEKPGHIQAKGFVSIPAPVADATLAALLQAITNSVTHAGPPDRAVRRVVTFSGDSEFLEIRLQDDGVGFDPSLVSASRLGIKASIVGRMGSLPGGKAVVASEPGKGTIVTLSWRLPQASREKVAPSSDDLVAEILTLRLARILAGIFVAGQVLLFSFSTANGGNLVASLVALFALCTPVIVVAHNHFRPSQRATIAIFAGVIVAASMVFSETFSPHQMRQDFWFLTGCAFLLMWLLRSSHLAIVWIGMASMAGLAVAASVTQGQGVAPGLDMVARPMAILLVGTLCSVAVKRLQQQISLLRTETSRSLERESFNTASAAQRYSEAVRLRQGAGPLLAILSEERELTSAEAQDCVALEGTLRDQILGGRLSRPAIITAAARARRRGVDVVLIDDGSGVEISDNEILRVERWVGNQLDDTTEGRFVGRIPPAGSPHLATIVSADSGGPSRRGLPRAQGVQAGRAKSLGEVPV